MAAHAGRRTTQRARLTGGGLLAVGLFLTAIALAPGRASAVAPTVVVFPPSPTPISVDKQADCESLDGAHGDGKTWAAVTVNGVPSDGTYPATGSPSVTLTDATATFFHWTSTVDVTAVYLRSGNDAFLFLYPGATDLLGTIDRTVNAGNGINHTEFCYVPVVVGDTTTSSTSSTTTSSTTTSSTTTSTSTTTTTSTTSTTVPSTTTTEQATTTSGPTTTTTGQQTAVVAGNVITAPPAAAGATVLGTQIRRQALAATGSSTAIVATIGAVFMVAGMIVLLVSQRRPARVRVTG